MPLFPKIKQNKIILNHAIIKECNHSNEIIHNSFRENESSCNLENDRTQEITFIMKIINCIIRESLSSNSIENDTG